MQFDQELDNELQRPTPPFVSTPDKKITLSKTITNAPSRNKKKQKYNKTRTRNSKSKFELLNSVVRKLDFEFSAAPESPFSFIASQSGSEKGL